MGILSTHLNSASSSSVKISVMMLKMIVPLTYFLLSLSFTSAFNIHFSVNVETSKQDSIPAVSPRQSALSSRLTSDLDATQKKLADCGVAEILKCSSKIEESAAICIKNPDVQKCIAEILGAEHDCMDCIEAICKLLHIPGCS